MTNEAQDPGTSSEKSGSVNPEFVADLLGSTEANQPEGSEASSEVPPSTEAEMRADKEQKVSRARGVLAKLRRHKDASHEDDAPVALHPDDGPDDSLTKLDDDVSVEEELKTTKPDRHFKLSDEQVELVTKAKGLANEAFERQVQAETLDALRKLQFLQEQAAQDKKDALAQLTADERDVIPAVVAHYDDLIAELQEQREATPGKVRERLEGKRAEQQQERKDHAVKVLEFQKSGGPALVYEPSADASPAEVLMMAKTTNELLRRSDEPIQTDEYTIKDADGNQVLMQRLVFRTGSRDIVMVEDWDVTNAMLKRQVALSEYGHTNDWVNSPIKDDIYLRPSLLIDQNLSLRERAFGDKQEKNKLVFNEELYRKEVGLLAGSQEITKKNKVAAV